MQGSSLALSEVHGDRNCPMAPERALPLVFGPHSALSSFSIWLVGEPRPLVLLLRRWKLLIILTALGRIAVVPCISKPLCNELARLCGCLGWNGIARRFICQVPEVEPERGWSSGTHTGVSSTSDPVIFLPKGALDQFTEPAQGLIHHLSELLNGQPGNSWEQDGIWAGTGEQMCEGGQGAGAHLNKSLSCIHLAVVWNCTSSKACVRVSPAPTLLVGETHSSP